MEGDGAVNKSLQRLWAPREDFAGADMRSLLLPPCGSVEEVCGAGQGFCDGADGDCRWLKFEEDVEDGGERWSKPYVATLSLHSLFELRSCILNGTVLLDICANSIEEIAGTGDAEGTGDAAGTRDAEGTRDAVDREARSGKKIALFKKGNNDLSGAMNKHVDDVFSKGKPHFCCKG